ncbi:MAG: 2-oxoacid:acceptor oxidoreductase family protein [bacterium]
MTNTSMMGALVKATGVVDVGSLEEPLKNRFGKIAKMNWDAVQRAYSETVSED